MFWANFVALCAKNNTKPNPVATELGISSGTVTKWKKGLSTPSDVSVKKIADYFNVPVADLVGKDKKIRPSENIGESNLSESMEEAFIILNEMSESERQLAVRVLRGLRNSEDN